MSDKIEQTMEKWIQVEQHDYQDILVVLIFCYKKNAFYGQKKFVLKHSLFNIFEADQSYALHFL